MAIGYNGSLSSWDFRDLLESQRVEKRQCLRIPNKSHYAPHKLKFLRRFMIFRFTRHFFYLQGVYHLILCWFIILGDLQDYHTSGSADLLHFRIFGFITLPDLYRFITLPDLYRFIRLWICRFIIFQDLQDKRTSGSEGLSNSRLCRLSDISEMHVLLCLSDT